VVETAFTLLLMVHKPSLQRRAVTVDANLFNDAPSQWTPTSSTTRRRSRRPPLQRRAVAVDAHLFNDAPSQSKPTPPACGSTCLVVVEHSTQKAMLVTT
jgi:hypothetical protein